MAKTTEIAWTDSTFNPWIGCAKVSPGCQHCYAEILMDTRMGRVQWGPNGTRSLTSPAYWKQPLTWNAEAKRTGTRRKVFCGSLCDWLEDRQDTNAWRIGLLELIELTPHLDWLMLTKRPENAVRLIQQAAGRDVRGFFERNPHVWFGTSVEDRRRADERIPHLLSIPARVRFLSMEPLLGPVDLIWHFGACLDCDALIDQHRMTEYGPLYHDDPGIHWVIVGGESGHNARPMHPDWARSIRDQCQDAGVPFFFKQWGEWWPHKQGQWVGGPSIDDNVPDDDFYCVGKKAAGRLLDGREWSEMPQLK